MIKSKATIGLLVFIFMVDTGILILQFAGMKGAIAVNIVMVAIGLAMEMVERMKP